MQAAGMADQAILDVFIKEYGQDIFRAEPNAWGRVIPYASIGFGLVAIWLFIRRYRNPRPAAAPVQAEDPALARYGKQIEKDLSNLD